MRRHANLLVIAMAVHGLATSVGHADFIQVVDQAEWESALSAQESIFFTEFPPGTVLWDQYVDLGVFFPDGNDFINSSPPDGGGVFGFQGIGVAFDRPRTAIAIDFPGLVQYMLYSEGELIFTSDPASAPGGEIAFFGILSDQPFDAGVIFDPAGGQFNIIDNLYFGDVIPAPGAMAIFGLAALTARRRRRK